MPRFVRTVTGAPRAAVSENRRYVTHALRMTPQEIEDLDTWMEASGLARVRR